MEILLDATKLLRQMGASHELLTDPMIKLNKDLGGYIENLESNRSRAKDVCVCVRVCALCMSKRQRQHMPPLQRPALLFLRPLGSSPACAQHHVQRIEGNRRQKSRGNPCASPWTGLMLKEVLTRSQKPHVCCW